MTLHFIISFGGIYINEPRRTDVDAADDRTEKYAKSTASYREGSIA
jgi:hypothetical protein